MAQRPSSNFGKILVTGATGNVGSSLIPNLTNLGADVRALARDESKAQGLKDAGVEIVVGDLDKPDTLDAAFRGVDKVFLITPPNPNQISQAENGIQGVGPTPTRPSPETSLRCLEVSLKAKPTSSSKKEDRGGS